MRVLARRLQPHQVDDVDHAHLQLRQLFPQERGRSQRLQRRHVATAGQHDVGLGAVVLARRPLPDAEPTGAVGDGLLHRQVGQLGLLAGDDEVDVVAAAQAVVADREQAVGVRRQVDADDLGLLVDDVVDEAGVLVGEAVVVLAPDVRGEQVVERGERPPPRDLTAHLQPLGVLVEHRVDDVDEGLIAAEEAVPAGQQIALQPALAEVLGEDLHHAAVGTEVFVGAKALGLPLAVGRSKTRRAGWRRSRRGRRGGSCRGCGRSRRGGSRRAPASPPPGRCRAPQPQRRSRGSRAAAARAAAGHRWRAGWRSSAALPAAPARPAPGSPPPARRTAPRGR